MPTSKKCPKCGTVCDYKVIVPMIVYGYECENCGQLFNVLKLMIGGDWSR